MQLLLPSPTSQRLQLHGLCFPFPVATELEHGRCEEVFVQGQMQLVGAPAPQLIWPLEIVNLVIAPHSRMLFHMLKPGDIQAIPTLSAPRRRPITVALALEVFQAPQCDWHAGPAARAINIDGRTALSRKLLSEGQCLREIVITQRLMRLLFDLSNGLAPLQTPARYGFPDRSRIEDALYDRFGLSATLLRQMFSPAAAGCTRWAA